MTMTLHGSGAYVTHNLIEEFQEAMKVNSKQAVLFPFESPRKTQTLLFCTLRPHEATPSFLPFGLKLCTQL